MRLNMSFNKQDGKSHLFLVRLRSDEIGECLQPENRRWTGRVQRIVTGETYEFRGWAELVKRLGTMLDDTQAGSEIDEQPS